MPYEEAHGYSRERTEPPTERSRAQARALEPAVEVDRRLHDRGRRAGRMHRREELRLHRRIPAAVDRRLGALDLVLRRRVGVPTSFLVSTNALASWGPTSVQSAPLKLSSDFSCASGARSPVSPVRQSEGGGAGSTGRTGTGSAITSPLSPSRAAARCS